MKRPVLGLSVVLCLLSGALPEPARAQGAPASSSTRTVVPLLRGTPAPFSGLLVPELRMSEFLRLEIDCGELKATVEREQVLHHTEVELLRGALARAQRDLDEAVRAPWYKNRWVVLGAGIVLGVALTTSLAVQLR